MNSIIHSLFCKLHQLMDAVFLCNAIDLEVSVKSLMMFESTGVEVVYNGAANLIEHVRKINTPSPRIVAGVELLIFRQDTTMDMVLR